MRPVRKAVIAGISTAVLLTTVGFVSVAAPDSDQSGLPASTRIVTSSALKESEGRGSRQTIPVEHRQALLDKGYSQSDIDQAIELAWQYAWSVDHLLQWHRNGTDWQAITSILKSQAIVPKPEYDKLMPLEFGPDGQIRSAERTWSGMTQEQVAELNRTFTLEEIRKADSLAVALELNAPDLLELLRREGSWAKVLTAVEVSGRPETPGGTSRVKLDQGARSRSGLTADQLNALVAQGFEAEDVMRADAYAAQSGGSVERALRLHQSGLSWTEVLRRLRTENEIVPGTNLTELQFGALQEKGFDRSDIATATSVSAATGQSVEVILQMRGTQPWSDYILGLIETSPQARAYFSKPPQLRVETISQEEAQLLLGQGYSPQDVLIADALSPILLRPVVQILAEKGGTDWEEFTKLLAESDPTANEKLLAISSEGDPRPMPSWSGMKEGEYRSLLASGYSYDNIAAADAYATIYGLRVHELLKMHETSTWDEITQALAERRMLNIADNLEQANWRARGIVENDIRQAKEISRLTGRSYQSILQMKTLTKTWLEIAEELSPGKIPPVHLKGGGQR